MEPAATPVDRAGQGGIVNRQGTIVGRAAVEDRLVRDNLPLVHYAVAELAQRIPSHVSRSDLVSAGMLGLAQAARGYDAERGVTFERFASVRIRGALLDELRGRDWASRSVRAGSRRMQAVAEQLTTKLGRPPTNGELAESMNVDAKVVEKLVDDVHRATVLNYESLVLDGSFESMLSDGDSSPETAILDRERRAYLTDAVAALPERLRHVVVGYFFEERPMEALARELGVTESRISQLRAEALELLRDGMTAHLDTDALAPEPRPNGRVARRKAAYYASVAAMSDHRSRVAGDQPSIHQKIAAGEAR
jgi:RNA polymerase sigma factor FliA